MTSEETGPVEARGGATVASSGSASADRGGIANSGVMGDVRIEHYHVGIPAALRGSERPTWMPLENGVFSFLQDTTSARDNFTATLLHAMIESFGDRPARFTFTLHVSTNLSEETPFVSYEVWCHHREFVARAARRHRELFTRAIDVRLQASDVDAARRDLHREMIEKHQAIADWQIEENALFVNRPVPHTVTYDPAVSRLRLEAGPVRGTDPEGYDDKVATTSEALAFACEFAARHVALIGDPLKYSKNRALIRLITYLSGSHVLDLTRFRVVQGDPETWDFRYP